MAAICVSTGSFRFYYTIKNIECSLVFLSFCFMSFFLTFSPLSEFIQMDSAFSLHRISRCNASRMLHTLLQIYLSNTLPFNCYTRKSSYFPCYKRFLLRLPVLPSSLMLFIYLTADFSNSLLCVTYIFRWVNTQLEPPFATTTKRMWLVHSLLSTPIK